MAKTLLVIYLLLSTLLFCELIDEAHGSRLRCHHPPDYSCKKRSSHHHHHYHRHHKDTPNELEDLHRSIKRRREYSYGIDAFRPTSPGHSPGVGH